MSKENNKNLENPIDTSEQIIKLRADLDRAYREMAEGVREFLDLRHAFQKEREEKQKLREAAVKAIISSSNTSEALARNMLDSWLKTMSDLNSEENNNV
jgi:hypothetical protein